MRTRKLCAFAFMFVLVLGVAAADLALSCAAFVRREFVAEELEKLAGRPVHIERVSFGIFRGFLAEGVEIRRPGRAPLLSAGAIRLTLDPVRLLRGQVAIASVTVEKPFVHLDVLEDGRAELFELVHEISRHVGEGPPGDVPRITVRGGSFDYSQAGITGAEKRVSVRDVRADIMPFGPGQVVVRGSLDGGALGAWTFEGPVDVASGKTEVRAETRSLDVCERCLEPFGDAVRTVYRRYNASGPVDVSVSARYDPDASRPLRLAADVAARGLSIEYANFPYRVDGIEGVMRLRDDGIEFRNMSARPGGKAPMSITMTGSTDGYVAESAYELDFAIDGMPLDRKLRGALEPATQKVFDMFGAAGAVRGRVKVHKPSGAAERPVHDIDMSLLDCSATFAPFPLPVTQATGLILLRGEALTIQGVRCRHGDAWFRVDGQLTSLDADGGIEVTVDTESLALSTAVKEALPPAVRDVWDHLDPSGRVGIHWETKRAPGADSELCHDVTVKALGASACFDAVPYRLSGLVGEVRTDGKTVHVKGLEGSHGDATIGVRGTVTGLEGTMGYDLTFDAREIAVDGDLLAALPESAAKTLRDLGVRGRLGVTGLQVRDDGRFDAGKVTIKDGSLDAGLDFREMEASLTLSGRGNVVHARLADSSMRVAGLKLEHLGAILSLDDGQVHVSDVEGTCYGGRLRAAVAVDPGTSRWALDLSLKDVDMLALTRDTSFIGKNISGKAGGRLKIHGTGGSTRSIRGDGSVDIRDGALWEVPVMAGLFPIVKPERRDVFDRGSGEFYFEDGFLVARRASLESKTLDLVAEPESWIDMKGRLGLLLRPTVRHSGPFGPLLRGVVGVYVTGTFKEPKTKTKAAVDLRRIFKK